MSLVAPAQLRPSFEHNLPRLPLAAITKSPAAVGPSKAAAVHSARCGASWSGAGGSAIRTGAASASDGAPSTSEPSAPPACNEVATTGLTPSPPTGHTSRSREETVARTRPLPELPSPTAAAATAVGATGSSSCSATTKVSAPAIEAVSPRSGAAVVSTGGALNAGTSSGTDQDAVSTDS